MNINAHPLCWPEGWKRTPAHRRLEGKFGKRQYRTNESSYKSLVDLTIGDAVKRVRNELQRMGIREDDFIVSTNLKLRLDGLPRSDQAQPQDAGVAVYWTDPFNCAQRVIAIDQYRRVQDNLAAIAGTLEAMRSIERYGGAVILERAFTGFTALPAPATKREWWDVLECRRDASPDVIKAQYRRLASEHHPDRGGDAARMAEINRAFEEAQQRG